MGSTEKISLSLDSGSLLLARRAAAIEGMSLSAWLSRLVRRHAWESERPRLSDDEQTRSDEHAAELDEQEAAEHGEEWRAAG